MNTIDQPDEATLPAQLRAAGLAEYRLTIASRSAAGLCEAVAGVKDEATVSEAVDAFQNLFETVARGASR